MISTKGRYAIRFMIDLAEQPEGIPVALEDVAQRQGVSKKYMESIVKLLVGCDLVKGASGKGGGYRLLRKPQEYTMDEIITAAEGTLAVVACLEDQAAECARGEICKILPMWKKYDEVIHNFFSNITLADLVNGTIK